MTSPPPIRDVHETAIYGDDLDAMVGFYRDVLGLELVDDGRPLMVCFRVSAPPGRVLLIFDPARAGVPGRAVPSHGTRGAGHFALRIDEGSYDAWVARLREHGVAVEHEEVWKEEEGWRRGRSVYVRDPAGNSVELVTADIWPTGERG